MMTLKESEPERPQYLVFSFPITVVVKNHKLHSLKQ